MRYGSVCSGIEAASVAWEPLGFEPAWFAEIEPYPSAVLKERFPHVPNYGDFTAMLDPNHEVHSAPPIDLLVGGCPCQDFSVAGLRAGIEGARGHLTLAFLQLARILRPRWLVYENVPGLLTSDGGRAFGAFLGGLEELGYGWSYRTLDAQYVRVEHHERAVPQRRRRVFVVGHSGADWLRPASVLLEPEGSDRDSVPRRTTREEAAAALGRSLAASGVSGAERPDSEHLPVEEGSSGGDGGARSGGDGVADVAGTLDANYGKGAGERGGVEREVIALQDVRDVQKAQNGRGWNADGSAYTPDTHATQGVAQREVYRKAGRAMSSSHAETRATVVAIEAAQPAYTMFTGDGEVADPITANEGKTYTHEGTTFRMHNCVGEHVGFYPTAGQDFPALNGCSPAVKVGSGGSAGNPPDIAMVFREAVSYTVSAKWAKGSGGYAGQNECDNCVLEGTTPLEGTTSLEGTIPLEAPRAVPVEEPDEVLFVAEDEQDVAILLAEMFAPPVEEPDEVLFIADDADEVAIMVAALFATVDAPERPASVSGNGYTLDAQREVSPTLTAKMQGSSGWAPWNEDAHPIPTADAATLERGSRGQVVSQVCPSLCARDFKSSKPEAGGQPVVVEPVRALYSSNGIVHELDGIMSTLDPARESRGTNQQRFLLTPAPHAEAITENHDGRVYTTPVPGALMAGPGGKPGQGYPTVMVDERGQRLPTLAFKSGQSEAAGGVFVTQEYAPTLQAQNNGSTAVPAVAHAEGIAPCSTQWWDGSGIASTVTTHSDVQRMPDKGHLQCVVTPDTPAVAFNGYQRTEGDAAWPLGASDGRKVEVGVRSGMAVRRLTPTECERLMGFSDGHTRIPWRGKPVSECPDGPRYKALGNSMAVNCMRFIGERIVFVDAVFSELEAASEADE